jgi:hypothetical protein
MCNDLFLRKELSRGVVQCEGVFCLSCHVKCQGQVAKRFGSIREHPHSFMHASVRAKSAQLGNVEASLACKYFSKLAEMYRHTS